MQKIDYRLLPVYEQKERILKALEEHQAVVVQSPTGSGKTTQLPVILYEASYAHTGMIAVTQPRRIAALSVSEFIAKQLNTTYPGLVGYKMRFEDKTDFSTKIKIMTDGILLQEMKLDPWLSRYSVVMVDEAHERRLNIDFVWGLLKRVLAERKDFKVIISSATMNAQAFSDYFNACPVVTIDTITYPVTLVYDPPAIPASRKGQGQCRRRTRRKHGLSCQYRPASCTIAGQPLFCRHLRRHRAAYRGSDGYPSRHQRSESGTGSNESRRASGEKSWCAASLPLRQHAG